MTQRQYVILLSLCFIWIISFSAITPLERVDELECVPLEMFDQTHSFSAIDYSALWNSTYGGFDNDRLYDLIHCEDGGYAAVGSTESFGTTDRDTWVVRTDEDGTVLWTKNLGYNGSDDQGNSIYECLNGDFVIAGQYATAGGSNGYVVRVSGTGVLQWTYEIGISSSSETFRDIIEANNGVIIAIGQTDNWGAGLNDVLVVSVSPSGSPIWTRTYGGGNSDTGYSIVESTDGGYALLANTFSYGAGDADFWLVRIDGNGNPKWNQTYGGGFRESGYDIIQDTYGGYVMAGQTKSFGDPQGDFYVVRVNSDGTLVWDEFYVGSGEDFATGIVQAYRGGYAIVGISDYIGINPQTRITRIEPDNTETWSSWYGGSDVDYGYELVEIYPEEYVVAGTSRTYGAGNFDGWIFLIPGEPRLIDSPIDQFFEFGDIPSVELQVRSSSPLHTWWIEDTTVFDITRVGDSLYIYTLSTPDVGFYEIWVHVNNTAGHEKEHIFWIYVDDTTAPHWTDFTAVHTLEFGDQFQYTPQVADLSLLGDWFLTGSSYFTIDISRGEITNSGSPLVGEYNLEIQVNDMYHNSLFDDLQIVVQDTVAPVWDQTPQDQEMIYGTQFVYDLNASDLAGLSSWWVDNQEFSVDSVGRVRNLVTLAPGDHTVTVYVSDNNDNIQHATFTIHVGSPFITEPSGTPSIIDSAILFGAGVIATTAVAAVVCALGRRKPSGSK
ncbi:MAG: hypothetical protein ACFFE2_04665 [Candidatus Thorarchaeota archaeon]